GQRPQGVGACDASVRAGATLVPARKGTPRPAGATPVPAQVWCTLAAPTWPRKEGQRGEPDAAHAAGSGAKLTMLPFRRGLSRAQRRVVFFEARRPTRRRGGSLLLPAPRILLAVRFLRLQALEIALNVFTPATRWSYSSTLDAECVTAAPIRLNSRSRISLAFRLLGAAEPPLAPPAELCGSCHAVHIGPPPGGSGQ